MQQSCGRNGVQIQLMVSAGIEGGGGGGGMAMPRSCCGSPIWGGGGRGGGGMQQGSCITAIYRGSKTVLAKSSWSLDSLGVQIHIG